ncbi:MAG TPA: energy transducer TonB [Gammaproteobacteria bacterium]
MSTGILETGGLFERREWRRKGVVLSLSTLLHAAMFVGIGSNFNTDDDHAGLAEQGIEISLAKIIDPVPQQAQRATRRQPEPRKQPPPAKNDAIRSRTVKPQPEPEQTHAEQADRDSAAAEAAAARIDPGKFNNYLQRLRGELIRHRQYPYIARRYRQQGVCIVGFTVYTSGRIADARIVKSSGHSALDEEAMRMLQAATPLPPIPESLARDKLVVEVPVEFSLR